MVKRYEEKHSSRRWNDQTFGDRVHVRRHMQRRTNFAAVRRMASVGARRACRHAELDASEYASRRIAVDGGGLNVSFVENGQRKVCAVEGSR